MDIRSELTGQSFSAEYKQPEDKNESSNRASDNHMKISRDFVFGEDGFPLNVSTWSDHGDYPPHTHDFSEIAIVLEGTGIHRVAGKAFPFRPGDVFVTHGRRAHSYAETRNLTLTNVTYDPKIVGLERYDCRSLPGYQALFIIEPTLENKESTQQRHLTLSSERLIQVNSLCDVIHHEMNSRKPGYKLVAVGYFMALIAFLSRCYHETTSPDAYKTLQLGRALSYLEKHYAEDIDIEVIAQIAAMSKRSLYRAFREVTGKSPLAYLLNVRLMKAVEQLEFSDTSVTEIAFDCGFKDSNYFSRRFREVIGENPSAYRKKYRRS